jgi:hypothetical protein
VPYKINIYEKGDFFKQHQDSSEPSLVATIIYHLSGDTECFVINGNVIWESDNNVCMFYTDIQHEVRQTLCNRQTITFKVYNNNKHNASDFNAVDHFCNG